MNRNFVWNRNFVCALLLVLAQVNGSTSIADDIESPSQFAVKDLPVGVAAVPDKVTFQVNWDASDGKSVKYFLVNNSANPIEMESIFGQVQPRLETRLPNGKWARVDSIVLPTCGTGIESFHLKPGNWLSGEYHLNEGMESDKSLLRKRIVEYRKFITGLSNDDHSRKILESQIRVLEGQLQANETGPRRVRLRFYEAGFFGWSNEGKGKANLVAAELCKSDHGAVLYADIDELQQILNGKKKVHFIQDFMHLNPKHLALLALERPWHPQTQVEKLLKSVVNGDDKVLSEMAAGMLKKIER